jgi:hypothetical protein
MQSIGLMRADAGSTAIRTSKRKKVATARQARTRKWSAQVTESSDALDLEHNVFRQHDPKHIAASLKRSAEQSRRRKADPIRSAMSMLTFFINRAAKIYRRLEQAKGELRKEFGRVASRRA